MVVAYRMRFSLRALQSMHMIAVGIVMAVDLQLTTRSIQAVECLLTNVVTKK